MRGASDTAPLVAWTQTGHVLPTMDAISFHRNNLSDSTFGGGWIQAKRKGVTVARNPFD
jgi:hypothetical protein